MFHTPIWIGFLNVRLGALGECTETVGRGHEAHQVVLVEVFQLHWVQHRPPVRQDGEVELHNAIEHSDAKGGRKGEFTFCIISSIDISVVLSGACLWDADADASCTPQPARASQLRIELGSHPRFLR